MELVALLHFGGSDANKNVVFMSSCVLIWHLLLQNCTAQIIFGAYAQGLVRMLYENMLDKMERGGLFPLSYSTKV